MVFADKEYLCLLLLLMPCIIWYVLKRSKSEPSLQVSDTRAYMYAPKSIRNYLQHLPFVLRMVALSMLIVILARPQTTDRWQNSEIEGIDIMLAMDVSTSMLAEDLQPNRLEDQGRELQYESLVRILLIQFFTSSKFQIIGNPPQGSPLR